MKLFLTVLLLVLLAACAPTSDASLFDSLDVTVSNSNDEAVPVMVLNEALTVTVSNSNDNEAVPVRLLNEAPLVVQQRVPIAVTGEWPRRTLDILPSTMIIHDLFFYVFQETPAITCQFTMNFIVVNADNTESIRQLKKWSLLVEESAEVHWEAGVLASKLRFNIRGAPGRCQIYYMANGYESA